MHTEEGNGNYHCVKFFPPQSITESCLVRDLVATTYCMIKFGHRIDISLSSYFLQIPILWLSIMISTNNANRNCGLSCSQFFFVPNFFNNPEYTSLLVSTSRCFCQKKNQCNFSKHTITFHNLGFYHSIISIINLILLFN